MDLPIVPRREPPRGFRLRYRYDYRTDTWRRQTPEFDLFGLSVRAPGVVPVKPLTPAEPDIFDRLCALENSTAHK